MKRVLATLIGVFAVASLPQAATITVNTVADQDGTGANCALREAIVAARDNVAYGGCIAGTASDTIELPAGTFNLSLPPSPVGGAQLRIYGDTGLVRVRGVGAERTIVDGNNQTKGVFSVSGDQASLTLEDMTITGGNANTGGALEVGSQATATVRRVHMTGNMANGGGALYVYALSGTSTVLIDSSTISDNDVDNVLGGGAMVLEEGSNVTILNSTISGNRSTASGAINIRDANVDLVVANSTIAFNAQLSRTSPLVAGISSTPGASVILRNSILAHNYTRGEFGSTDCGSGTFTSQGYNVFGNVAGCTLAGQTELDLLNTDPRLLPLFDYGGPTPTLALRLDSPARDAGNPAAPGSGGASCPSNDQRAASRGSTCDIGAYDYRQTFVVDTSEDGISSTTNPEICDSNAPNGGGCTVRSALYQAGQRDTFTVIRLPAGRYFLRSTSAGVSGGDLNVGVDDAVMIQGDGANRTFIEMQIEPNGQANNVLTLSNGSLALIGVTLTGGQPGAGIGTGGIQVGNSSQVANALLFESAIENSIGFNAGGAYVLNNASLRLERSTISRNRADYGLNGNGGGIYVAAGGELVLLNSTVSDNVAEANGGGIYSLGSVRSTFSTVAGNRSDSNGDAIGSGGGIHRSTGSVFLKATLLAGNIDSSGIAPDCAGSVQRQGFNLIGTTTGCTPGGLATTELANVAAPLSPLANFGGPTRTRGLMAGNPAINHVPGPNSSDALACADDRGVRLVADQRGTQRPAGGNFNGCDIGASEGLSDVIFIDGFDG